MKFLKRFGLWWPQLEGKEDELMLYLMRKVNDCDVATRYCSAKGVAVQAGGHIGLWPRQLAKYFSFVYTFEPVPELFECLKLNTAGRTEVIAEQLALGSEGKIVNFSPRSGGRGKVAEDGDLSCLQVTIDSLDLLRCDLIYLDVERHELDVLAGAVKTIEKYSPVLAVEVLKDKEDEIHAWMKSMHYTLQTKTHSDEIYAR